MADDKTKRGSQDRSKIDPNERYEVDRVAEIHKVPVREVDKAIEQAKDAREQTGHPRTAYRTEVDKIIEKNKK